MEKAEHCSNCDYFKVSRAGRCNRCYRYWRAMGQERPADLIEKHIEKYVERARREPCTV